MERQALDGRTNIGFYEHMNGRSDFRKCAKIKEDFPGEVIFKLTSEGLVEKSSRYCPEERLWAGRNPLVFNSFEMRGTKTTKGSVP